MPVDRKTLLMAAVALAVLVLVARSWWPSTPAPVVTGTTAQTTRPRTGRAVEDAGPVGPVKLGSLIAPKDSPGQQARNPFRFQPKFVPPPPRPVAPPPPTPSMSEAPRPSVPTGPPPPPPIPLKLIGVLERANGVKWAILSDGKSSPMYGKDGDIIDGRYTIVKIGTESIEMAYADGRGRQVIRLNGGQ